MKILAFIVVVVAIGGFVLWNRGIPPMNTADNSIQIEKQAMPEPTASNYDECIELGNAPLAEDSDKCLTKEGYLFIKGVE